MLTGIDESTTREPVCLFLIPLPGLPGLRIDVGTYFVFGVTTIFRRCALAGGSIHF